LLGTFSCEEARKELSNLDVLMLVVFCEGKYHGYVWVCVSRLRVDQSEAELTLIRTYDSDCSLLWINAIEVIRMAVAAVITFIVDVDFVQI
jgi:hypothetical protein